jgi:magnesium-transporting ATPase (P-type)
MLVQVGEECHRYKCLQVLEFTSARRRMSVLLRRPDGTIVVMVKGADTTLQPLLDQPYSPAHLEYMAKRGLRTLLLC